MHKLTVHVLDMASGLSAEGIRLSLSRISPNHEQFTERSTAADGRCAPALLEGPALTAGKYRLVFELEDYFLKKGQLVSQPVFLPQAIIEFQVAPETSYHIPLVITPFSYSVYRGS